MSFFYNDAPERLADGRELILGQIAHHNACIEQCLSEVAQTQKRLENLNRIIEWAKNSNAILHNQLTVLESAAPVEREAA